MTRRFFFTALACATAVGCASRRRSADKPTPTRRLATNTASNVRSGPGTSYAILGTLPAGTYVDIHSAIGKWTRIAFKGRSGWIHGSLLGKRRTAPKARKVKATPSPRDDGEVVKVAPCEGENCAAAGGAAVLPE